MSDHVNYRRAAAENAAAFEQYEEECLALAVYEPPRQAKRKAARKARKAKAKQAANQTPSACEAVSALPAIHKDFEVEVLEEMSGYCRKKSNMAVSFGALPPADRTWFEACLGDAMLRALPYFDEKRGVKLSTFLIQAAENYLIDEDRKSKRLKRKAVLTPITTVEVVEAQERGLVAEEALEDRSKGGWKNLFFEMDYREFMASLTDTERYLLSLRLDYGMSFDEIAEMRGMSTNTWKRHEWLPVQQKAITFGFEGKTICA